MKPLPRSRPPFARIRFSRQVAASLSLLFLTTGCAHGRKFRPDSRVRQTCLVLSVGAADGLAHLGAIRAVKEAGVDIDCVTGTSMGALVGGLYASQPEADTVTRYSEFISQYIDRTEREASDNGLLGALFLGGLALATGGAALLVGGAAVAGGVLGASSTDPVQLGRFSETYDTYLKSAQIQDLPLSYATFYLDVAGDSVHLERRASRTRRSSRTTMPQLPGTSILASIGSRRFRRATHASCFRVRSYS